MSRHFSLSSRLLFLVVAVFFFTSPASAAELQVRVFELTGTSAQAVTGARVCLGTQNSPASMGSLVVGNSGSVTFSNINMAGQYLVTVSASGFRGQERIVNITGNVAAADFTLERCTGGDCGPVCDLQPEALIRINKFEINRGNEWTDERKVGLFATLEGAMPTQYQVSESPDFINAAWLEFNPVNDPQNYPFDVYDFDRNQSQPNRPITDLNDIIRLPPGSVVQPVRPTIKPKYGNRTLYLRFRVGSTISAAGSDSIELRPKMKQYFIFGNDLMTLLRNARDEWGFTFTSRVTDSNIPSFVCPTNNNVDGIDFDLPGVRIAQTYSALSYTSTKTIEAFFFGGRNLNEYWQLKEMNFVPGDNFTEADPAGTNFRVIKQLPLNSPLHMVRFKWTGKQAIGTSSTICFAASIKLFSILVEGPEGSDWRDAFRRN